MSAYAIAMVSIHDPDRYKKYTDKTPALIEKHGGRFLARGGDVKTIEGDEFTDRLVIIEFPSQKALDAWYNDPDYQEVLVHRHAASKGTLLAVAGV